MRSALNCKVPEESKNHKKQICIKKGQFTQSYKEKNTFSHLPM